jgi:O-acetyl-ADP-ribose deacetylase (regulator of RNase III)
MALVELVIGDKAEQGVDVVMKAANSFLLGGAGSMAPSIGTGAEILAECCKLRVGQWSSRSWTRIGGTLNLYITTRA